MLAVQFNWCAVSVILAENRILCLTRTYSENPCVRTCWQKFAIRRPKNIRTCLAKQDQAGSSMWVTVILTKKCNFEIANVCFKKIHNTVVNKYCILKDQTQVYLLFW